MLRLVVIASALVCCLGAVPRIRSSRPDERIVGGNDADITDYPYQLILQYRNMSHCGASAISENWGITAAHCVQEAEVQDVSLRVGTSIEGQGGSVHQASKVIVHEDFSSETVDNDIALVQVATDFPLGNSVQIIPLTSSTPATGVEVTITGWGLTQEGGSSSKQLQVVKVPVVDHAVCEAEYINVIHVTEHMFCAGLPEGGKSSCTGDSGGPVVTNGQLVGIVSWAKGCAQPDQPDVYSDVASLRSWVAQITGI